jgi:hypothetical protein
MNVMLDEEETSYVLSALRSYQADLRMEIVDTDNVAYKRDLRREREVLDAVLAKLDSANEQARAAERAPAGGEAGADEIVGFRLVAVWETD